MKPASPGIEDPLGFRCARYEVLSVMGKPHRHHEVEINFLERGSVTSLFNGALVVQPTGSLAVFWATMPHQIVSVEEGASGFTWITVPLAWLLQWNLPAALVKSLLRGEYILDRKPVPWDASRVQDWGRMLARKDADWKKIALLEIQGRLHQLALGRPSRGKISKKGPAHPGGLGKVEEIACFIAEHYREPITVEDIARHTRLHASYVMSLFRRQTGQTLIECLTQHRIAHAQRLLVTTDEKVLTIALESGFGSLSRFYTAFNASCKIKPLQYRQTFACAAGNR